MKIVKVPTSKSEAHRAIICAAFSESPCEVIIESSSDDIEATKRCVSDLIKGRGVLDVGESASTLRFIIPLAAALGVPAFIKMRGRLPERPIDPLLEQINLHGVRAVKEDDSLTVSGKLTSGDYVLPGDVSSQFLSGLLLSLPLLKGNSTVRVDGELESAPYVDMTLAVMKRFGVAVEYETFEDGRIYRVLGDRVYRGPEKHFVSGDWSAAANWIAAGVLGKEEVRIKGLSLDSKQGDMKIVELLLRMGADIYVCQGDSKEADAYVLAAPSRFNLSGSIIDASQVPDIVPILALVATQASGETVIYKAERLRYKECDRLAATAEILNALGASVIDMKDGLIIKGTSGKSTGINGKAGLKGGAVSSEGDHRLAMMAAIASTITEGTVVLDDGKCVSKSYPGFWDELEKMKFNDNIVTVNFTKSEFGKEGNK